MNEQHPHGAPERIAPDIEPPHQLHDTEPHDASGEVEPRAGPRIYAASLSDYNAGILHGAWIDAAAEPYELQASITAMLEQSPTTLRYGDPAEEWAIHDYDNFGSVRLGEYEPVEHVAAVARGIAEHGQAFAAWVASADGDPDAPEQFLDAYLGQWDSVEAYAEQLLDDFGLDHAIDTTVPESLRPYVTVDIEALAHDLQLGGDITVVENPEGGVWMFDGR